jgi:hypothetical protein
MVGGRFAFNLLKKVWVNQNSNAIDKEQRPAILDQSLVKFNPT